MRCTFVLHADLDVIQYALCECKRSSFLRSLKTGLPVNNLSLRLETTESNDLILISYCHKIDYDFGEVADEKGDVR